LFSFDVVNGSKNALPDYFVEDKKSYICVNGLTPLLPRRRRFEDSTPSPRRFGSDGERDGVRCPRRCRTPGEKAVKKGVHNEELNAGLARLKPWLETPL
jgi:hypothetical protein